ncbi:MAG: TetR/AcrR family transcriptional regulator [Aristaeellaceae bacterium]
MERKLDFRVQRTYASLQRALLELMSEKPFEAITVGELCERAMIRRATFYKHFGDKYELFTFSIRELQRVFEQKNSLEYDQNRPQTFYISMIDHSLQFVEHHSRLLQSMLRSNNSHMLFEIVSNEAECDIRSHLRQDAKNGAILPAKPELLAAIISGALVNTMKWWVTENLKTPRQELVYICASLIRMM